MNRPTLTAILLLTIPAFSIAATVKDPNILNTSPKEIFFKLRQAATGPENTSPNNPQNKNAVITPSPNASVLANDNGTYTLQQSIQSHQANSDYFGFIYGHIVSSDDAVWKELTSTAKEVNDSLNTIDHWAENILNTTATNIDLSAINLRNTVLIQENANLKSVLESQENDSALLTSLDESKAENLDLRKEYDLLNFLLSPSLLIRALAENFSIIVLLFTVLMGIRLLMKFILEKTKKRQRRRKGRRKRSIDGFIN